MGSLNYREIADLKSCNVVKRPEADFVSSIRDDIDYVERIFRKAAVAEGADQDKHTPMFLWEDIVLKLSQYNPNLSSDSVLVYNGECIPILIKYGVKEENITLYTDNYKKEDLISFLYHKVTIVRGKFLKDDIMKKFDTIIGNYPFHTKSDEKNKKTQPIWHKFVEKSFELCKEDGYVCAIHPSGWRSSGKIFESAKGCLRSKQIEYLEIHDENDGLKTFGATTRYDWYVIKNMKRVRKPIVKDQDGIVAESDVSKCDFIPNCKINRVFSMIAKDQQEKVTLLGDSSYHTQRPHLSIQQKDEFIYPIIYSTPVDVATKRLMAKPIIVVVLLAIGAQNMTSIN